MKKRMRAWAAAILAVLCIVCFTACGDKGSTVKKDSKGGNTEKAEELSKTAISVNKDGSISSKIVEDFGESYYNVNDLESMIKASIEEYTSQNASAKIKLKDCKASGGKVNVHMEFGDYESYADYNYEDFFAGTIQEANRAGFDLNVTVNDVSDAGKSISKPELLGMGDRHMVIMEAAGAQDGQEAETVRVNCFGEILYVSEGVTAVGKKSADVNISEGYGIIIFK